jgi:hypothetical protein
MQKGKPRPLLVGILAHARRVDPLITVKRLDEVTFLSHIRGGGLDLVQWQLPATKNQTMSEATYGRRYTDGARSAAG